MGSAQTAAMPLACPAESGKVVSDDRMKYHGGWRLARLQVTEAIASPVDQRCAGCISDPLIENTSDPLSENIPYNQRFNATRALIPAHYFLAAAILLP